MQGGWSSGNDPRAVFHGKPFIGWVRGDIGDVGVNGFTLRSALQSAGHPYPDVHNAPGLLIHDDELHAFYCAHDAPVLYLRKAPLGTVDFGPETTLPITGALTYPNPFVMDGSPAVLVRSAITPWPGGAWSLLHRDGFGWSSTVLFNEARAVYMRAVASDGRVDFALGESPTQHSDASLYAFHHDGQYRRSDGTPMGSPPFTRVQMTKVHQGTSTARCWLAALAPGRIGYSVGNIWARQTYRLATLGGTWSTEEVATAGDPPAPGGQGGMAIVGDDVIVSRQPMGVYRYRKTDRWRGTYIAPGMFPAPCGDGFVWLDGRYAAGNDFLFDVQELASGHLWSVLPDGSVEVTHG